MRKNMIIFISIYYPSFYESQVSNPKRYSIFFCGLVGDDNRSDKIRSPYSTSSARPLNSTDFPIRPPVTDPTGRLSAKRFNTTNRTG
ncbi:hypothetical protein HanIR_Chr01g0019971 [Helianthus annuus]|nr:hypothetical protein HanIR_Chr01g0019971 [Helianthus annuus]